MSQFAVYRNRSPRSKAEFPLLVDVQSELLDQLETRVVIPLTKAPNLSRKPISKVMPTVEVGDETYLLMAPQLAGILKSDLGVRVGSIAQQRSVVVTAMDMLITGV